MEQNESQGVKVQEEVVLEKYEGDVLLERQTLRPDRPTIIEIWEVVDGERVRQIRLEPPAIDTTLAVNLGGSG